MKRPVIFLAFANDLEAPLPELVREDDNIYRALSKGALKGDYLIHREAYANQEKIARYLVEYKDDIDIFHYAGHAESDRLLHDQEASSVGLTELLANQRNLKLVFLNGCATMGQVEQLLASGIPAVIATSSPINDTMASDMAMQFYEALAKQQSIRRAFAVAVSFIKVKFNKTAEQYRGIKLKEEKDEFPWGLYTESDEILDWKLPANHQERTIILRNASDQFNFTKTPVNEELTNVLIRVLRPYNRDIDYLLAKAEDDREYQGVRQLQRAIMDSLPAPIGEQVRKLFSLDLKADQLEKIGVQRLKQFVRTYDILLEYLAHVLLSMLRDVKRKQEELELPEFLLTQIRKTLTLSQDSHLTFDYHDTIKSILQFFDETSLIKKADSPVFIEELSALWEAMQQDEVYKNATAFMREIKVEMETQAVEQSLLKEAESFCVQSEIHLAEIFQFLGFWAKYKLHSIKDISVTKSRNKGALFRHFRVKLDTITAGYKDADKEFSDVFTDNRSVILLKEERNIDPFLNLSPFIIDERALLGQEKSKLFFFSRCDREKMELHYKYVYMQSDQDELVLSDHHKDGAYLPIYEEIKEQFDAISQLFFGKNLKDL